MLRTTSLLHLVLNKSNPLKLHFSKGVGAHQELQTKC